MLAAENHKLKQANSWASGHVQGHHPEHQDLDYDGALNAAHDGGDDGADNVRAASGSSLDVPVPSRGVAKTINFDAFCESEAVSTASSADTNDLALAGGATPDMGPDQTAGSSSDEDSVAYSWSEALRAGPTDDYPTAPSPSSSPSRLYSRRPNAPTLVVPKPVTASIKASSGKEAAVDELEAAASTATAPASTTGGARTTTAPLPPHSPIASAVAPDTFSPPTAKAQASARPRGGASAGAAGSGSRDGDGDGDRVSETYAFVTPPRIVKASSALASLTSANTPPDEHHHRHGLGNNTRREHDHGHRDEGVRRADDRASTTTDGRQSNGDGYGSGSGGDSSPSSLPAPIRRRHVALESSPGALADQ